MVQKCSDNNASFYTKIENEEKHLKSEKKYINYHTTYIYAVACSFQHILGSDQ